MNDAKKEFTYARNIVDPDQNPGMAHIIEGLIRLSDQLANMDYRLRQIESDVSDLKKRL